ncbi:hypothetical protein Bca101_056077 [Brassica carinata]
MDSKDLHIVNQATLPKANQVIRNRYWDVSMVQMRHDTIRQESRRHLPSSRTEERMTETRKSFTGVNGKASNLDASEKEPTHDDAPLFGNPAAKHRTSPLQDATRNAVPAGETHHHLPSQAMSHKRDLKVKTDQFFDPKKPTPPIETVTHHRASTPEERTTA